MYINKHKYIRLSLIQIIILLNIKLHPLKSKNLSYYISFNLIYIHYLGISINHLNKKKVLADNLDIKLDLILLKF